jgi:hypothetical protein
VNNKMITNNVEEAIKAHVSNQLDKGSVTQAQAAAESKLGQAMAKKPKMDPAWQTIVVHRASDNSFPLRKSQVGEMSKKLQPFPKLLKEFENWVTSVWNPAHNTSGTIFDDTNPIINKVPLISSPPQTDPSQPATVQTMRLPDMSGGKKWEDFKNTLAETPLPYAWRTPWSHIFSLVSIAIAKSVVSSWIRWSVITEPMSWIFAFGMGCNWMGDLAQTKGFVMGCSIKFAAL